jgi:LuxR family maltose regulon positive regulatory protein
LIAELIEKQPPNLHLVIITRKDPPLPLPRLRAANEMTEIRQRDLRFQTEEVQIFLQQTLGRHVEPATTVALNKHTEGWAVGLRLVALSLRETKDLTALLDNFQGKANLFVTEYLVNEVLAQQPQAIRVFTLECAILDRMCDPLCQAVTTASADKEANLERVEAANLFLVALDNRGEWYRFHHLFQELLLRKLHEQYQLNEVKALHQRASLWFAKFGYTDEAIQHALKAGDTDRAAYILETNGKNLLNSLDRYTLERWLSQLPEEIIWQRPRLILAKAWLLLREFRLTALNTTLDVVEAALEAEEESAGKQSLQGQIAALRAFTAAFRQNDSQRALMLAEKVLQLPESERDARSLAIMPWAFAQHALGNENAAVQALQKIIQHPAQTSPSKLQTFITLALLRHKAGQLQQMSQVVEQFLTLAAKRSNPNAIGAANMFAGSLYYERDELQQAADHFSVTYDYRYKSNFITVFGGGLGLGHIHLAKGDADKAQAVIDALRADTLHLGNIDLLGPLDSFQAYLWLANGELTRALRWARAVEVGTIYESVLFPEVASLTYARILIFAGSPAEVKGVVQHLHSKLAQAKTEYFTLRVIQINIFLALAQQKLDKQAGALLSLEEAVMLAQPGGFIRTFVDAGSELRPLLEKLQGQNIAPDYLPQILAAFPDAHSPIARPALAMATLLTRRETQILKLMRYGRSNQEIADELVISIHTVKRHATNIYNKLEVNGRQSAIYRAKELNILS